MNNENNNIDNEIEASMSRTMQIQEELKRAKAERERLIELYNQAIKEQNNTPVEQQPMQSPGQSQSNGKKMSLNNGHSILGDDTKKSNGFVSTLILSLLVGFAGGALTTAAYIFTALGKVTVSL